MKKKVNQEYVFNRVSKALDSQFEIYSWEDMLNDCDLSPTELAWAKEHIGYQVCVLD